MIPINEPKHLICEFPEKIFIEELCVCFLLIIATSIHIIINLSLMIFNRWVFLCNRFLSSNSDFKLIRLK